eukprot:TRINITY_DN17970_c0_g1_i1.p1 TRINITY_DN17970_c0_g1~~TRINITY_DN17970_c0_g1_i1.p1  ORF type:complete len:722 (-),score=106.15 TRINITY_DN17970_c0_g1_i1:207-2372(-)
MPAAMQVSKGRTGVAAVALSLLLPVVVYSDAADVTACQTDTTALLHLQYISRETSALMATKSGLSLGDYGDYDGCQKIEGAHMCLCNWGTGTPFGSFQGYCLPKSCQGNVQGKPTGFMPKGSFQGKTVDLNTQECSCGDAALTSMPPGAILTTSMLFAFLVFCGFASYFTARFAAGGGGARRATSAAAGAEAPAAAAADSAATSAANRAGSAPLATVEEEPRRQSPVKAVLRAFDVSRNWESLCNRDPNRKYQALDGLRAISMFWVILGHTANFSMNVGFLNNQHVVLELQPSWTYIFFLWAANFSVDTFFYLSGFLTTHVLLSKMKKSPRGTPFLSMVIARWMRLVPTMFVVIMLAWQVGPHLGKGPLWFMYTDLLQENCQANWWTHLLFINNFYPVKYGKQCLGWTWYLANDFQFTIIGIALAKLYFTRAHVATALAFLLMVASMATTGILTAQHNINIESANYQDDIYDKPYTRASTYLIGVLGAFFLNSKYGTMRPSMLLGNFLGLISLVCLLGSAAWLHSELQCGTKPGGCWNLTQATLYNIFSRPWWTLGVALLAHLCNINVKGPLMSPISTILSFPLWDPIGKLTFSAYLIHPVVIRIFDFQIVTNLYYTPWWFLQNWAANALVSYTVATVLFVTVESPFGNLLQMAMTPAKKTRPLKSDPMMGGSVDDQQRALVSAGAESGVGLDPAGAGSHPKTCSSGTSAATPSTTSSSAV